MEELIKILIGMFFLLLGIPIGSWLAQITSEELKSGQKWFKVIIIISLIVSFITLIIQNDVLLFSFLFIAIITVKSLKR